MHKFTIFTIIFSIVVMVIVAELVIHDYLKGGFLASPQGEIQKEIPEEISEETAGEVSKTAAEISEEEAGIGETTTRKITTDLLAQAGFENPIYKQIDFSGLIFQIIDLKDLEESAGFSGNVFEEEEFAGTVYEIHFETETEVFRAYELARAEALASEKGSTNETNSFGEASFYFNHADKPKTVFLVVQIGNSLYAFEYSHRNHLKFKELVDFL